MKISVVMPCFNKARFINEALESLRASSLRAHEIIIVDDASTDGSREVIERWAQADDIQGIYLDENRGVVNARNTGVNAARGELIFMLDADDRVAQDGLARMAAAFKEEPGRWVYTDLLEIDESGQASGTRVFPNFDTPHPYRLAEYNVTQASILYPKAWWEEVGGYHARGERGYDDWLFAMQLLAAGHCGQRLQYADGDARPAVHYRKVRGSRNKTSQKRRDELRGIRKELFPEIFQGLVERKDIMACCGGRGRQKPARPTPTPLAAPAGAQTLWVVYRGPRKAPFNQRGQGSRRSYHITPGVPIEIDVRDRRFFLLGTNARYYTRVDGGAVAVQPTKALGPPPTPPPPPPEPIPEPVPVEGESVAEEEIAAVDLPEKMAVALGENAEEAEAKLETYFEPAVKDPATMFIKDALMFAEELDPTALQTFYEMERDGKERITLMAKLVEMGADPNA